jgi:hypothetical protein
VGGEGKGDGGMGSVISSESGLEGVQRCVSLIYYMII